MPTTNAFAQSISPFGKGNPIQSLSDQIDRLEDRLNRSENNPLPTSISGLYESTMIGSCFSYNRTDPTRNQQFYTFITYETPRFNPDGTIWRSETFTSLNVSATSAGQKTYISRRCGFAYEMTKPFDGTFTWKTVEPSNECPVSGDRQLTGSLKLKGRIFDGGKTLTLRSEELGVEYNPNNDLERKCIRTNTLRKISE